MNPARSLVFAAALAVPACRSAPKSAVDWQQKAPYQAGTALRHVPPSCAGGHLYVDLPVARRNEALRTAIEIATDRFVAGAARSANDKRSIGALNEALHEEGVDLGRDIKELAACWAGGDAGVVFTVGGDFSGKDVFGAVQKASAKLGDKQPEVEVARGVPYVRLGAVLIARPAPNVLALGEDLAALTALGKPNDRASAWGVTEGRAAVARLGKADDVWVALSDRGAELEIQLVTHTKKTAAEMEARRSGVADRLGETPLKMLVPAVRATTIAESGGTATFTLRPRTSDAAWALRAAVDLAPGELRRIVGYVFAAGEPGGAGEKI